MKKITLTEETKQGLLQELLKRSPESYGSYESIVQDITKRVRREGDRRFFPLQNNSIIVRSMLPISLWQRTRSEKHWPSWHRTFCR